MFDRTQQRAKTRAQDEAGRVIDVTTEELSRIAFEVLEDRFSERLQARRRRDAMKAFVVGIALGFSVRHLLR